jgi:integrase
MSDKEIHAPRTIQEAKNFDCFYLGETLHKKFTKDVKTYDDYCYFIKSISDELGVDEDYIDACMDFYKSEISKNLNNQISINQKATPEEKSLKLLDAFKAYIKNIKLRPSLSKTSLNKYILIYKSFYKAMGNIGLNQINETSLREYFEYKLRKMPKNLKKYSAPEQAKETISESTFLNHIGLIKSFFIWCVKMDYIDKKCLLAFDGYKKKSDLAIDVLPFTNEDLKKIFESDSFARGLWLNKHPERHWGLLLALYTGARLKEICMIKLSNIKQDTESKVLYIDYSLRCNKDVSLKTKNSYRKIPIHSDLIQLGFLKYVRHLQEQGHEYLFQSLQSSRTKERKLGRWFNKVLLSSANINIEDGTRKSFHSFRHTLINYEKQKGLNEAMFCEIVGHSSGNSIHKGYQREYCLSHKKKELNKVIFDIDISKIKKFV